MSLIRWAPFSEIDRLQRQMNRLFDETAFPNYHDQATLIHTPSAEISETEEALILKLEVPGMEAKDLDVEVTKESVTIRGERKQEETTTEKGVTRSEFRYGKFERIIPLPIRINNNDVSAEYKDGILNLTLPKVEEEKNKVVKINLG